MREQGKQLYKMRYLRCSIVFARIHVVAYGCDQLFSYTYYTCTPILFVSYIAIGTKGSVKLPWFLYTILFVTYSNIGNSQQHYFICLLYYYREQIVYLLYILHK